MRKSKAKRKRALVTGGAGFVGSNLAEKLLENDYEVIIYDNFSIDKRDNLPKAYPGLHVTHGDILQNDRLQEVFHKFDPRIVFHLAAIHYIPYCNANPIETVRVNVEGTQSVLECCKRSAISKFIFASSAAVYPSIDYACKEDQEPKPKDMYGITKFSGEMLVKQFHTLSSIPCTIARLFNIYGPKETNPHVIPHILTQLESDRPIELGNLEPKRDYIYVGDIVSALMLFAEDRRGGWDIYNVGTGQEYSVRELIAVMEQILGRTLEIAPLEKLKTIG